MAINDNTLSTDVWTTIRTTLLASAPYITNSSTSATTAASIEGAYKDKNATKPQIVINPITDDESDYKFGSSTGRKNINISVDCYYKNTLGTDQLADQVVDSIKTAIDANSIPGMELIALSKDQAFVDPNQSKFQLKSVTFSFLRE